eukprot:9253123-Lingulodinium_polyedra.AAC.1
MGSVHGRSSRKTCLLRMHNGCASKATSAVARHHRRLPGAAGMPRRPIAAAGATGGVSATRAGHERRQRGAPTLPGDLER